VRTHYILSLDKDITGYGGFRAVLDCYTSLDASKKDALDHNSAEVLIYTITDASNVNSARVLIGKARENARGSQDKITKELWEQINALYHYMNHESLADQLAGPEALAVLDYLHQQCLLFNGVIDSTMPRGLGWSFMNVGKFIERSLQSVDMLQAYMEPLHYNLDAPEDLQYWRRVLLSLSGYELYLKNNRGGAHCRQVLQQVVFDKDYPRSVLYSLERIEKYIDDLTNDNPSRQATALQKQFGRLRSMVAFTDTHQVTAQSLRDLLNEVKHQIWDFSAALSRLYFSYM
jgi:uncharacterized alpha-E superfamily protein